MPQRGLGLRVAADKDGNYVTAWSSKAVWRWKNTSTDALYIVAADRGYVLSKMPFETSQAAEYEGFATLKEAHIAAKTALSHARTIARLTGGSVTVDIAWGKMERIQARRVM